MNVMMRWLAAIAVFTMAVMYLPTAAQAAPLPAPVTLTPTLGAVLDQPIFSWAAVEGAASYEIEVALDDQFVTLVDPPKGATQEVPPPIPVYGTHYVPTRSYQAKTMYWHVRAVGTDAAKGAWSPTRDFVRRWTNTDEAAGTEVDAVPASRVNKVRVVGGGSTPPINNLAVTWEPVPGAAFYEVQFSSVDSFPDTQYTVSCWTPHSVLAPYFTGSYVRRSPSPDPCAINSPIESWAKAKWSRGAQGTVDVEAGGVEVGDTVVIRYLPDRTERTFTVDNAQSAFFTIDDTWAPSGESSGELEWFKVTLNIEANTTYYARVRAVDSSPAVDYPALGEPPTFVYGMWSDHRREPGEPVPRPLEFTPVAPAGSPGASTPAIPTIDNITSTDVPTLTWQPAVDADLYRVTIALDRDFTDIVGRYTTRSASFTPAETYDDNGPRRTYYWYALPCQVIGQDTLCVPDRDAINENKYVATFAKHSAPVTGLSATLTDGDRQVVLRWGDALSAALPDTPGGVSRYQVQISGGDDWSSSPMVITDNLAYSTTLAAPLPGGTYRWRVRPLDGDQAGLAWAVGTDFTLTGPPVSVKPTSTPSPTDTTIPSANPTPTANYDINPGAGGGTGNVAPSRPGKPQIAKVAKRTVRVRWNSSTAYSDPISAYLVMRSRDGRPFKQVARTSARTVRLAAKRGSSYQFYVVAVSAAGNSRPSATATFTMR